MKVAADVKAVLHTRLLRTRSIIRIVESSQFERAYDGAVDEQRGVAQGIINNLDLKGLKQWLQRRLGEIVAVEEMSMRELRKLGQRLGVKQYYTLPRESLITALKQREDDGVRKADSSITP